LVGPPYIEDEEKGFLGSSPGTDNEKNGLVHRKKGCPDWGPHLWGKEDVNSTFAE